MKKSKIYLILAIITAVILFTTAGICNQCSQSEELTPSEGEPPEGEEPPPDEVLLPDEEPPPEGEEPPEEEPPEEEPPEEEPTEEELSAPAIELEIYEGPLYSEADGVCYYRVKAIVTGSPAPEVEFSKDDSSGAWGPAKCQINLGNPSETYTLTATASSSEGEASDSIEITWGCEEEPADGGLILEGLDPELELTPGLSFISLNPSHIGYVIKDLGFAWSELCIGDLTINADARGFFAFDLSSLAGKGIISATLILDRPDDETRGDPSFKGKILLYFNDYLPLGRDDYSIHPYKGPVTFENDEIPLEYSSEYLASIIQERANEGKELQFALAYENSGSDDDGDMDGRFYNSDNINLIVTCDD